MFFVIILLALSYFGYSSTKKHNVKKQAESRIQELPSFSFFNLNEELFTYQNIEKEETLLIYFHPDCEHCQYEAKQIVLNKEKFKETQIIMISPASLLAINQFNKTYELNKIKNLEVLWDKERKFENYFGVATFPTILIYDDENQLQKKHKGEVKIEAILKELKIKEETISSRLEPNNNMFNKFNSLINVQLFLFKL